MSILLPCFSCLYHAQNFLKSRKRGEIASARKNSSSFSCENVDYNILVSEIKPLEDIMVGFAVALKERHTVNDEILLLSSIIESFYDLKSRCISLGANYENYFSRMWEHCHNSQNADFPYIEKYEERLGFLQQKKNILLAEEQLKDKEMVDLDQKIIEVLKSKKEILQTDLYKCFDPVVQSEISSILYFMAKDGTIHRTKSGKTYLIKYQN